MIRLLLIGIGCFIYSNLLLATQKPDLLIKNRFFVIGVISSNSDSGIVVIKDAENNKSITLKIGSYIPGTIWKLKSIDKRHHVIVSNDNKQFQLPQNIPSEIDEKNSPVFSALGENYFDDIYSKDKNINDDDDDNYYDDDINSKDKDLNDDDNYYEDISNNKIFYKHLKTKTSPKEQMLQNEGDDNNQNIENNFDNSDSLDNDMSQYSDYEFLEE